MGSAGLGQEAPGSPAGVPGPYQQLLGLISSVVWLLCASASFLSLPLSPLPCFLLDFIIKCTYTECIKHVCKVTTCIFVWPLPRVRHPGTWNGPRCPQLSPEGPPPPHSVLLFLLHFLLVSLPSLGSLNTVLFHLASFELYLKDRIVCNSLWPWFKKISGSQLRGVKNKV